jgi:hypothetical protein
VTGASPQPGANHAAIRRERFRRATGLLIIALLVMPLGGCLLPLASDLGLAHTFLQHHHLFKPVLSELPIGDEPPGDRRTPPKSAAANHDE